MLSVLGWLQVLLDATFSCLGNLFSIDHPSGFLIYIKGPYHVAGYLRLKPSKEATRLMVMHLNIKGTVFMIQMWRWDMKMIWQGLWWRNKHNDVLWWGFFWVSVWPLTMLVLFSSTKSTYKKTYKTICFISCTHSPLVSAMQQKGRTSIFLNH